MRIENTISIPISSSQKSQNSIRRARPVKSAYLRSGWNIKSIVPSEAKLEW